MSAPNAPNFSAGPLGAAGLSPLFDFSPTLADVSFAPGNTATRLNAGMFYSAIPAAASLTETNGMLTLVYDPVNKLNGTVSTQNHLSQANASPHISAARSFYVEFEVALSDADPQNDHFFGVWLEPQEHNLAKTDSVVGMPIGYEAWTEIDVEEGGNAGGVVLSSLLYWHGIYAASGPSYSVQTINNAGHGIPVSRAIYNRFGLRYDASGQIFRYYLNDENHTTFAGRSLNPAHHYYMICDVTSRGADLPYSMIIKGLRAWQ